MPFRIAEVEGSIPFESTKNGNRRGFYHGEFSFDHRNTTDGFLFCPLEGHSFSEGVPFSCLPWRRI